MKRKAPLIIDGIEIPPAWMCGVIARQKREHQEQLTLRADQRYTRVAVVPGKTYLCGCDYRGSYTVLCPTPGVVDKKTCPTHGQPVAS